MTLDKSAKIIDKQTLVLNTYIEKRKDIDKKIQMLQDKIDKMVGKENINYGHVGNLCHIEEMLNRALGLEQ